MNAGARQSPHPRIDPGFAQGRGERGAEQDVIEAHARVSFPCLSQVVPKGVDGLVGVGRLDRVGLAYRGPPLAAALMCAATPILTTPTGRSAGPLVRTPQDGAEHRSPERTDSSVANRFEKSSLSVAVTD